MKRVVHGLVFLALASFGPGDSAAGCCGNGCGSGMGKGMMAAMQGGCGGGAATQMAASGAKSKSDAPATRHPLRGVIVSVHADTSELRVKHEAVPGVMRAMTMMFKVDAAAIKTAKAGQTITAQMSREGDAWWLHDVKVVGEAR